MAAVLVVTSLSLSLSPYASHARSLSLSPYASLSLSLNKGLSQKPLWLQDSSQVDILGLCHKAGYEGMFGL
jgi:hypothetical protein